MRNQRILIQLFFFFFYHGKCQGKEAILPNARLVSRTFHTDQNVPSNRLTQLFTIFGQFVDHDLTLTNTYTVTSCCNSINDTDRCLPIMVPPNDAFFSAGKCLEFKRSLIFCEERGCQLDPMNAVTAYTDASTVYGSDATNAAAIRAGWSGKLATSNPGMLLPIVNGVFLAGEGRATEHPALASMHTIFVKEHNRIAEMIRLRQPG
jgi:peroxidase